MSALPTRSPSLRLGDRLRPGPGLVLPLVFAVVLLLYVLAFARDWGLPGLYMDSINPEYLIPGILHPPPQVEWLVPGNKIFGDRFPVFTGTIYHGSVQLYAALPFMAVFGADLETFRFVQLLVGGGILGLAVWLAASGSWGPKRALAAGAAGLLAIDPAFVLSLRTQAYSTIFPLLLLFGSILLMRGWRDSSRAWLRLLLSGFLYGLAVFSYFIFGFFLPALLWLLLRPGPGEERHRSWTAAWPWVAGCVIGYLPFVAGILLIRRELGGTSQLVDWLRTNGDTLEVSQDKEGVFGRIATVFEESRRVFTGEWPWLMILGHTRSGVLETLKSYILLLLPLAALFVPRIGTPGQRRALRVPIALVLSFAIGALIFGSRLDGHHYSAVLPLLYIAFGCACAALWPWDPDARWRAVAASPAHMARGAVVVLAVLIVAVTSLRAEQAFHDGLQASGGYRLYSDSINRFAEDLDETAPTASVHTPDWGWAMPVGFLSEAGPVRSTVDIDAIRQETCAGKPQVVVFAGDSNEGKLRAVSEVSRRPLAETRTWSQRDGVPVFQTGRIDPTTDCGAPRPPAGAGPGRSAVRIAPAAIPQCGFANIRIALSWAVPERGGRGVEIVVSQPGAPEALLAQGDATGVTETGPWGAAGMRFSVRDAQTHRELTSATVGSEPCPST